MIFKPFADVRRKFLTAKDFRHRVSMMEKQRRVISLFDVSFKTV